MQGATDVESGSLVLNVDRAGLSDLVQRLGSQDPAEIEVEPAPPKEALRPITRLSLRPGEGDPLLIAVDVDAATIAGSHENFEALADELQLFEQENDLDEPGMHVHFDPSDQEFRRLRMSSDSVELIVTGPIPDAPVPHR